jgi:hypothetical protein
MQLASLFGADASHPAPMGDRPASAIETIYSEVRGVVTSHRRARTTTSWVFIQGGREFDPHRLRQK